MAAAAAVVRAAGRRLPKAGLFLSPGSSLIPPLATISQSQLFGNTTVPKVGLFVPAGCTSTQQRFAGTVRRPDKQRRRYVTGAAAADLDAADEHAAQLYVADTHHITPVDIPTNVEMVHGVSPEHFLGLVRSYGTTFFAGVSDSRLKDVCAHITDKVPREKHVIAAGPVTALAHAGYYHRTTGKIACVYLQNFGLGSASSPLLTACGAKVEQIPMLLLVAYDEPAKKTLQVQPTADTKMKKKKASGKTSGKVNSMRGLRRTQRTDSGGGCEEEYVSRGQITPELLKEMAVPYEVLPDYAEGAFEVLEKAYKVMARTQRPFALLFKKDTFRSMSTTRQNKEVFMDMLMNGHQGISELELQGTLS